MSFKIAPSEETWRLAEKIRRRQHDQARRISAVNATPRRSPPVVGRDGELAILRRAWRSAAAGSGGVAVVHGAAGMGKTRLVSELVALASGQGAVSAVGASTPGCAPYWPWTELAGALLGSVGGVPERSPFTAALAPLLPTLIQPSAPGPPEFDAPHH